MIRFLHRASILKILLQVNELDSMKKCLHQSEIKKM